MNIRVCPLACFLRPEPLLINLKESRSAIDSSDSMLLANELKKLQQLLDMDVNLFAVAWSAQLPKLVS